MSLHSVTFADDRPFSPFLALLARCSSSPPPVNKRHCFAARCERPSACCRYIHVKVATLNLIRQTSVVKFTAPLCRVVVPDKLAQWRAHRVDFFYAKHRWAARSIITALRTLIFRGYRFGSPTAVQAWRTCPLWEPSPSQSPHISVD